MQRQKVPVLRSVPEVNMLLLTLWGYDLIPHLCLPPSAPTLFLPRSTEAYFIFLWRRFGHVSTFNINLNSFNAISSRCDVFYSHGVYFECRQCFRRVSLKLPKISVFANISLA